MARNKGDKGHKMPQSKAEIDSVLVHAEYALENHKTVEENDIYDLTILLCMEFYNRDQKKRVQAVLTEIKARKQHEQSMDKKKSNNRNTT